MKGITLLFLACIFAQLSNAQVPGGKKYGSLSSPATDYYKQQLNDQVLKQLNKIDWNHVDRTTSSGSVLYTIPVVVHVLHNYGPELITDSTIHKMMALMNSFYLKTNADTVDIMDKFKPVAANTQIAFKLATKDLNGNVTKGVEHVFTYLTYSDNYNQSKINQWPPDRYLNIWTTSDITYPSGTYGYNGYAYSSYDAAYYPYYDGIIEPYENLCMPWMSRMSAEYLSLPHPCDCCSTSCIDADGIADTPPCNNEYYNCLNIYDATCDTPNTQNIMTNFDTCAIMFTYGQGQYMQNVLQLDFGNRDSLITPYTSSITGMNQLMPDMPPVADFSVSHVLYSIYSTVVIEPVRFFCQGESVIFENKSWNDTIIGAAWTFSNNAEISASTSLSTVINQFHKPGWVSVSLAATGNGTGTTTLTNTAALYIADSIPTNAIGYVQEFHVGAAIANWPLFNYYNNAFQWLFAYVGYTDGYSLEYVGYDPRTFPQNMTGTPQGDIDDIFTPGFDLTGFTDSCYLNFMSSGATRTTETKYMNDSFEIDYSLNAINWNKLTVLKGSDLDNKGAIATSYAPASMSDWVPHNISLPAAARAAYTIFRLRYWPGADSIGISTGNNFYLDHFNFNSVPESVMAIDQIPVGVSLLPNPTQGNSFVVIKDRAAIIKATVIVTDISGTTVYKTEENNMGSTARIEIPASVLTSKGLYLVHVITNNINQTEKLVVY